MSAHLQKFPSMTRERWAGVIFIGVALAVIFLIVFALGSTSARSLRYDVIFSEGKGLKVGDRVQLNGVDIGEVDRVELNRTGDQVGVRLKIMPGHRDKVLANSTAYIADPTLPNVSGQKVVEVYNSSTPSPPMQNQARIEGKNNIFELKAWQLGGQVEEWGKSMVAASRDLQDTARKLADDARKAAGNLVEGMTESLKEGPGGEVTPPAAPDSAIAPKTGDAATSPSSAAGKPLADANDIAYKLNEFLKELGSQGEKRLGEMSKQWEDIRSQIGPKIEELARNGREFVSRKLQALMEEIQRQMDELRKNEPPPAGENPPVQI